MVAKTAETFMPVAFSFIADKIIKRKSEGI